MNRRQFLKSTAQVAAGLSLVNNPVLLGEPRQQSKKPPTGGRKLYHWLSVDSKASTSDLTAKYAALKRHGLDGVFLGGGIDDREFEIVRESELELHTWMWTTNRGDQWIRDHHPDWYMVSRTGKSCFDHPPYVEHYRWVSPVIPGVQRYLEDRVGELASHKAVNGVHLDYVRYPDVILPRGLWKNYGLDQTNELPDYDFCYSSHTREAFKAVSGRDPMDILDPAHDQEWLHFRYDSVTRLVEKLAKVAHSHRKQITAAVFPTPRLARKICRQDWDKWPLDAFCPMIYNGFYEEGVDWIGDMVLEDIHAVDSPIYAGLYMPDLPDPKDLRRAVELAFKNGAAGVSLFGGIDDAHWQAISEARG